ncbi:hypothetical protein ACFQGX_35370 [Nonomuraea dietziae]|uniref:hypothetical protein n=1 Tax=Nonomuraea dietziae TaxID=65515 RepID=UPI003612C31C
METTTLIREATTTTPRRGHPLLRRWPTLVGLACGGFILFTAEPWQAADFVTWGLPMLALAYLIFGAFRGELRGRGVLTLQGGALAVYALLAGGLRARPRPGPLPGGRRVGRARGVGLRPPPLRPRGAALVRRMVHLGRSAGRRVRSRPPRRRRCLEGRRCRIPGTCAWPGSPHSPP